MVSEMVLSTFERTSGLKYITKQVAHDNKNSLSHSYSMGSRCLYQGGSSSKLVFHDVKPI